MVGRPVCWTRLRTTAQPQPIEDLMHDPFVETETGFGSCFSETMSSIYETRTSFGYPEHTRWRRCIQNLRGGYECCLYTVKHSNSGKKVSIRFNSIFAAESIFSIRFGNLINLPLVHWYSNIKLGVIFIICIALLFFCRCSTQYSFQLHALWCILIKNHCIWCVCVIYLVQKLHDN